MIPDRHRNYGTSYKGQHFVIDDDSFAEIKQIFIEEADEGLDIIERCVDSLAS